MYLEGSKRRNCTFGVISISIMFLLSTFALTMVSGDQTEGDALIMGVMLDTQNDPVEGVTIIVLDENGEYLGHTWSNSTGNFTIEVNSIMLPQDMVLVIMKDGYFETRNGFSIVEGNNTLGDLTITEIPSETESFTGTITNPGGVPVDGAEVSFEYNGPEGRYSYDMSTGAGGGFSFNVFPGEWELKISVDDIEVFSEDIEVVSGEGPYVMDVEVPFIPEKTVTIKGTISDGSTPQSGFIIAIRDIELDLGVFTTTNETGYYELDFWPGLHTIISFGTGMEAYQTQLEFPEEGTIWHNITLEYEEYWINGTVRDDEGQPLEDITVQFIKEYNAVQFNSVKTEADGSYSIKVSGGSGYLAAMEDDPFDTENYDVFFMEIGPIEDNIVEDIVLHEPDDTTGKMVLDFEEWESFSTHTSMMLPLNASRAAKAFIDIMLGNCDLIVSEQEREMFIDMMMEDDESFTVGPLNETTEGNLTVNGLFFTIEEESLELKFENLTGTLLDDGQLELQMSSEYSIEGNLSDPLYHVELVFNGSYQEDDEEMEILLPVPGSWMYTGSSDSLHEISLENGVLNVVPAQDPDDGDDIDFEFVTLFFSNDSFSVEIHAPQNVSEGENVTLELSEVDHVPDNIRTYSWNIEGEVINTTIPSLNYTFPENGTYDVTVTMEDDFQRMTEGFLQVEVSNLDPHLEVELVGGFNRTFEEGDVLVFNITGSDVEADPLLFQWGIMGDWSENLTLDEENSTIEVTIEDDGNFTFQVKLVDDDGGSTFKGIIIDAQNVDPDATVEIDGLDDLGFVGQGDWLTITVNTSDVEDDTITIEWEWSETSSIETELNGSTLKIRSLDHGNYQIGFTVQDEDGGLVTWNWTMQVKEDIEFDNDGDGMPRFWEILHELDDNDPSDDDLDGDLDGLTNLEEFENGTDPGSIDTDGDGMPDDFEIMYNGLNPKLDDADGDLDEDGLTNLEEFEKGSNPIVAEKDDKKDDNTVLFVLLIIIGLLLAVGTLALIISRRRETFMDDEE